MTSISRGVKRYLINKLYSNRGYIPPIMSLITKEKINDELLHPLLP